MKKVTLTVVNDAGLHARPAAQLTELAQTFASSITISSSEAESDAKSIIDLLLGGFNKGMEIEVAADGPDEDDAVRAIAELIGNFKE